MTTAVYLFPGEVASIAGSGAARSRLAASRPPLHGLHHVDSPLRRRIRNPNNFHARSAHPCAQVEITGARVVLQVMLSVREMVLFLKRADNQRRAGT